MTSQLWRNPGDVARRVDTVRPVGARPDERWLGAGVIAGVPLTDGHALGLIAQREASEVGGVAIIGVDAGKGTARCAGDDVLDDDMALVLIVAIAARAIKLAEVFHVKILDDHRAGPV